MSETIQRLYIFDADATLRRCTIADQACPNRPGEWEILPGVKERLALIDWSCNGFGIASNQGGIAKGYLTKQTAFDMLCTLTTTLLNRWPPVGSLQICDHPSPEPWTAPPLCACRKPAPGMLLAIMRVYGVSAASTLFVGDLPTDQQAAIAAGVPFEWAWDFFGYSHADWVEMLELHAGRDRLHRAMLESHPIGDH